MVPRVSIRRVSEVRIPPKHFEDATMPQHLRTIVGFFGGLFPDIVRTAQAWRDGDRQKNNASWIALASHATWHDARLTFAAKTTFSRDQDQTHLSEAPTSPLTAANITCSRGLAGLAPRQSGQPRLHLLPDRTALSRRRR
jgi:hypothetical protein